jgi:predicted DNA-binding ribbon-helix-helix protein
MKSSVVKRSIKIAGHKRSVSLEDDFWRALREMTGGRNVTLSDLIAVIDAERHLGNLSSAIRIFVLGFYRDQILARDARERTSDNGQRYITKGRTLGRPRPPWLNCVRRRDRSTGVGQRTNPKCSLPRGRGRSS